MPPEDAAALHGELGWSDPRTRYALREAIAPTRDTNVVKRLVVEDQSSDSLIYNYMAGKLAVAIGLEGMIVVNS